MSKSGNKTTKKNYIWYFAGLAVLFLIGLLVLLYPTISNQWNEYRSRRLTSDYAQQIDNLDKNDRDIIYKEAVDYNHSLTHTYVPDAFLMTDFDPNPEYMRLLNPAGDGYMGNVDIPAIDVNIPIYHYSSKEILEHGAGHLPGSSLPVGGKNTHCVISAHRGLPSAKLFTDLDRIKEGNQFYLHVLGETLAYEVDKITVVEPDDTKDLAIEDGQDLCTLLTCTPYAVNTHRLLVRGHRVPYEEENYEVEKKTVTVPKASYLGLQLASALLGLLTAAVIVYIIYRRSKAIELKKKRDKIMNRLKEENSSNNDEIN